MAVSGSTGICSSTHIYDQRGCGNCGKTDGTLESCSRCKKVIYCGIECQTINWLIHKKVCPPLEVDIVLLILLHQILDNESYYFPVSSTKMMMKLINKLAKLELTGKNEKTVKKIGEQLFNLDTNAGEKILATALKMIRKYVPDGPIRETYIKLAWNGIGDQNVSEYVL